MPPRHADHAQPAEVRQVRPGVHIDGCRAIWVDAGTLVVPREMAAPASDARTDRWGPKGWGTDDQWQLLWSPRAELHVGDGQLHGAVHRVVLPLRDEGLDERQRTAHPDLVHHLVLRVPTHWRRSVPEMLTGQLLVARVRPQHVEAVTGVQLGPVIDAVHGPAARDEVLGVQVGQQRIQLRLWAPTAQRVTLLHWDAGAGSEPPLHTAQRRTMLRSANGTWTTRLPRDQVGARYLYEVQVYQPATGCIETNHVTDPYSPGLTLDSHRSVVVDLADPALEPPGWAESRGPRLARLVDAAVYELHVRDFSACDELVPEPLRGSYLAFTCEGHGTRHLRELARAGMNTVHLLPTFDILSVPEAHRGAGPSPQLLASLPPDSAEQQRLVAEHAAHDAYNWGYDPYHWGVPEGSYASTPDAADGAARVVEFRRMVHALHGLGLRVVMDQVFTHTGAAGQHHGSVLDRIVPGYYHRLDHHGRLEDSTCMNNVATERVMAEKLMIDMVLRWARDYHVDGFRFDLMGHSSAQNMANLRGALDTLTLAEDGIVGSDVYLYGEGWNFGEVADNRLFVQATQGQLGDTRIGTFNDRIRDAVRGGRPFDENPRRQGFGSGLAGNRNTARYSSPQRTELGHLTDLLMLSMAGNLRDYVLRCHDGQERRGDEISYDGARAGYAEQPSDVINYVDAHDNETLWDALTLKLPHQLAMTQRIRMNTLCLATVTLGQAPFLWHAGADLLRSKSLDRNSYDSGDWFNRLDWTGADNGFGRGLPPAADNMTRWPWLRPLLANPALKPTADEVMDARAHALDLLRLRRSTPLLRLGSAELVRAKVRFPVAGTVDAIPGVVVMHVDDREGPRVDLDLQGVVVALNATPDTVRQPLPTLAGEHLVLSPVQRDGSDPVARQVRFDGHVLDLPGRTAAVLVHRPAG